MKYIKFQIMLLCLLATANICFSQTGAAELNLTDGSKLRGRVISTSATEITLLSDFGLVRVPISKLTPESQAGLSVATKPDVESLLRRIGELEARVAQLQQENDSLRRSPATQQPQGASVRSNTPQNSVEGTKYTVSSTGKRHNSRCRYFGSGRPAGPNDGVPCKICGG
jgi:hypothetical protein